MLSPSMSVDKVSAYFRTDRAKTIDVTFLSDAMLKDGFVTEKEWSSTAFTQFQHNYTFLPAGKDEGAVYLGLGFNGATAADSFLIKVEFNPNKVQFPNALFAFFSQHGIYFRDVKQIDLAFDFDNSRLCDFLLVPADGRTHLKYDGTRDNMTKYLGTPSADRYTKVYDKSRERQEKNAPCDGRHKTRVEITLDDPLTRSDIVNAVEWSFSQVFYTDSSKKSTFDTEFLPLCFMDDIGRADYWNCRFSIMDGSKSAIAKAKTRYFKALREALIPSALTELVQTTDIETRVRQMLYECVPIRELERVII